jgi:hypothetical protein
MRLSGIVIPLVVLICTSGCEPTPYQKAYTALAHGYSDKRFSQDAFHVQFVANYTTSASTLCRYLYRRAAELTVQHGFRYFAVVREPCPLIEYQITYRSQEDAEAWIDGMEVEVPAWGTMHMTIECFKDAQHPSGVRLIDAQAHLPKGRRPKRE